MERKKKSPPLLELIDFCLIFIYE